MEMKKCKECGKLFEARNSRQQYCSNKHYRPCPVCGKDVEIKYLSDPTPRCAECRKLGATSSKSVLSDISSSAGADDSMQLPEDAVVCNYIRRDKSCKFRTGHKYLVKVKSNFPYGYVIKALQDLTTNDQLDDVCMPISSPNSFSYFFQLSE